MQVYDCAEDAPDLLISDSPVVTPNRDWSGLNPRQGVSLGRARALVMPLGPRCAVALDPQPDRLELGVEDAELLNRLQEDAAEEYLHRRTPLPSEADEALPADQ